jgi:hypothetical protein
MVEIVDGQTVNQAANPFKIGRKKSHQFRNSRIALSVVLMLVL